MIVCIVKLTYMECHDTIASQVSIRLSYLTSEKKHKTTENREVSWDRTLQKSKKFTLKKHITIIS